MSPDYFSFVRDRCQESLLQLERLFKDDVKLTLIMRKPGNIEAEFVMTRDDLDDVAAVVERSKRRPS